MEIHCLSVLEKEVLLRTFGTKREETSGGYRELCDEPIYFYSLLNIISAVIRSRRISLVGHEACIEC